MAIMNTNQTVGKAFGERWQRAFRGKNKERERMREQQCPFGHRFGLDFDLFLDCNLCKIKVNETCLEAHKEKT